LKRFASFGVSLLAVVVTFGLMASPADARHRHHHHHRHGGGGGGGVVCGAGTVLVNGVCVATAPPGPTVPGPFNGGLVLTPNHALLQVTNAAGQGNFALSGVAHYGAGGVPGVLAAGNGGPGCAIAAAPGGVVTTDLFGNITFSVTGTGTCSAGAYAVVFTPTAAAFAPAAGTFTVSV
jgi:hypothetical protein